MDVDPVQSVKDPEEEGLIMAILLNAAAAFTVPGGMAWNWAFVTFSLLNFGLLTLVVWIPPSVLLVKRDLLPLARSDEHQGAGPQSAGN